MVTRKDQPWWVAAIDRFGAPTVVAALLALSIWRAIGWFAPKADLLIETHVKSVNRLVEVAEKQEESLRTLGSRVESDSRKLDDIHRAVLPPRPAISFADPSEVSP